MKIRGQQVFTLKERVERNSIPVTESGCWIWIGAAKGSGHYKSYGYMTAGSRTNGTRRTVLAHRASYMAYKGTIPDGLFVCHRCDIPACVNPEHLFLGTRQDNVDDRQRKNRNKPVNGEANPKAKLSVKQVARIKFLLGTKTCKEISELYGVSVACIKDISSGRNWANVSPEPPNNTGEK